MPSEVGEAETWTLGSVQRFERVEEALLYLIAGYDANAALTANSSPARVAYAGSPEKAILQRLRFACKESPAGPSVTLGEPAAEKSGADEGHD